MKTILYPVVWIINYRVEDAYTLKRPYTFVQAVFSHENEIPDDIRMADALIVGRNITISANTLNRLDHCKLIVRPGVGCDNIDAAEAKKREIAVETIPDYCIDEVADHTIALLLSYVRRISHANELLRQDLVNNWKTDSFKSVYSLRGKTLGIVGFGYIGRAVAARAKASNMRVLFFDPYIKRGIDKIHNCKSCDSFVEFINEADIISIHAPLTPETKSLFDDSTITAFTSPKVIINTARGKIITNSCIYNGIRSGKIEAYLSDVLENEPPIPDDPLIQAIIRNEEFLRNRLIITPHIAFYSKESQAEVLERTFQLLDLYFEHRVV